MRRACALPLAALALLLAACGGSGGGSTAKPTSSGAAATTTAAAASSGAATDGTASDATAVATGADDAVAAKAVLVPADLGAGWTGSTDTTRDPTCLTNPLRSPGATAELRGQQLSKNRQLVVRSIAFVYPDAAAAAKAFTLTSKRDTIRCYVAATKRAAMTGVHVRDIKAVSMRWPAAGDEVIGARVTVPVDRASSTVVITSDIVLLRAGRVVTLTRFLAVPNPFPTAQAAQAVKAAANRVAGA